MFSCTSFLPIDDDDVPQQLVSYFKNNYMGGERGRGQRRRRLEPQFSINLWNISHICFVIMRRTTNNLEAFRSALNRSIGKSHPKIWSFINTLQEEEAHTRTKNSTFLA